MKFIFSILIALLPTVFWLWLFLRRDKAEKEPIKLIIYLVLFSFFTAMAAGTIHNSLIRFIGLGEASKTAAIGGLISMLIVGFVEESLKLLSLRLTVFRSKYFNEVSDGVLYGITAGLGFAFIENIEYGMAYGLGVLAFRIFQTPLFHASASAIAGYVYSKGHFVPSYKKWKYTGLVWASLLHGTTNYLMFASASLKTGMLLPLIFGIDLILIGLTVIIYKRSRKEEVVQISEIKNNKVVASVLAFIPGFCHLYYGDYEEGITYLFAPFLLLYVGVFAHALQLPAWQFGVGITYLAALGLWITSITSAFVRIFQREEKVF